MSIAHTSTARTSNTQPGCLNWHPQHERSTHEHTRAHTSTAPTSTGCASTHGCSTHKHNASTARARHAGGQHARAHTSTARMSKARSNTARTSTARTNNMQPGCFHGHPQKNLGGADYGRLRPAGLGAAEARGAGHERGLGTSELPPRT